MNDGYMPMHFFQCGVELEDLIRDLIIKANLHLCHRRKLWLFCRYRRLAEERISEFTSL